MRNLLSAEAPLKDGAEAMPENFASPVSPSRQGESLSTPFSARSVMSVPSIAPAPLGPARIEWSRVRSVLVVRLRSIGDTVLATPSLYALRRFLPRAQIDILLEDWVAPLLVGSRDVDRIVTVARARTSARARAVSQLRAANYDVAFNLHGGSTAALMMRATGARHRVGYADYRYRWLHNHTAPPASALWGREKTHSVEQQLGLLGWMGVPVSDRPPTRLPVNAAAAASVARILSGSGASADASLALIHPAAAFESKQWAAKNYARIIEHIITDHQLTPVIVAAAHEPDAIADIRRETNAQFISLTNLALPEVTALAARARIFVGNDSGIAHIAAAVGTPSVVIFGSSNTAHWRPWTIAPSEVVREDMPCAPCAGYTCAQFAAPECIRRVPVTRVQTAIEKVLGERTTNG